MKCPMGTLSVPHPRSIVGIPYLFPLRCPLSISVSPCHCSCVWISTERGCYSHALPCLFLDGVIGTFSPGLNYSTCLTCGAGHYLSQDHSACVDCPVGMESNMDTLCDARSSIDCVGCTCPHEHVTSSFPEVFHNFPAFEKRSFTLADVFVSVPVPACVCAYVCMRVFLGRFASVAAYFCAECPIGSFAFPI